LASKQSFRLVLVELRSRAEFRPGLGSSQQEIRYTVRHADSGQDTGQEREALREYEQELRHLRLTQNIHIGIGQLVTAFAAEHSSFWIELVLSIAAIAIAQIIMSNIGLLPGIKSGIADTIRAADLADPGAAIRLPQRPQNLLFAVAFLAS
jgi:hypothetical protein